MNWKQRAIDCRRRAMVAHSRFVKIREAYRKADRVWSYWANRAVEAQREYIEVKKIDPKVGRKEIDKAKSNLKKLASKMTPSELEQFIASLKGEVR